jgi:hypothetical protein
VPSPVTLVQRLRGEFLQNVAWVLIEDHDEGLVAEGLHFAGQWWDIRHGVCGWEVEVGSDEVLLVERASPCIDQWPIEVLTT